MEGISMEISTSLWISLSSSLSISLFSLNIYIYRKKERKRGKERYKHVCMYGCIWVYNDTNIINDIKTKMVRKTTVCLLEATNYKSCPWNNLSMTKKRKPEKRKWIWHKIMPWDLILSKWILIKCRIASVG